MSEQDKKAEQVSRTFRLSMEIAESIKNGLYAELEADNLGSLLGALIVQRVLNEPDEDENLTRFDYLTTGVDEVVKGLEQFEKIYALEQRQYIPVRSLPAENGASAIMRYELKPHHRRMVVHGADILLEIVHFGGDLAPSRMMILNQNGIDKENLLFKKWFAAQSKAPYHKKLYE